MSTTSITDRSPRGRRFPTSPTLTICIVAALVAVVGLFAPSLSPVVTSASPQAEIPATGASSAGGPSIDIVDFDFAGDLVVRPGERVQVVNIDGAPHSITADDGSFDTGVLDGGAAGSFFAPDEDGVYSFICIIHPSMTGELTVTSS